MFNLLIFSSPKEPDDPPYKWTRDQVFEFTADEIKKKYKSLDEDAIKKLKSFPTLFAIENDAGPSKIGYITRVQLKSNSVAIDYEFDSIFPAFPEGTIKTICEDINLSELELATTHWAVKNGSILKAFLKHGHLNQQQIDASQQLIKPFPSNERTFDNSKVFIAHGHDENAQQDVAKLISELGLQPIILDREANEGMTIIEKIEKYSNVGFGIAIYTPCDLCMKKDALTLEDRARQNVVFEHGYLIAKLGRKRVVAIIKGRVEIPNDISGLLYIKMDEGNWEEKLKLEIENAGSPVDFLPEYSEASSILVNAANTGKYSNSNFSGIDEFDYDDNNGVFTIGSGNMQFDLRFSNAGNHAMYIYNYPENIEGIAIAYEATSFKDIKDATVFNYSSNFRNPKAGEIVTLVNKNGFFAAVKILEAKARSHGAIRSLVKFEYVINQRKEADFTSV